MNKYIKIIDSYQNSVWSLDTGKSVFAKPEEATGMLKWKIRFVYAFACLSGKAIAVKFWTGVDINNNTINM